MFALGPRGRGGEKWTKYRGLKFRRASAVY
jgi:hypothetical protein